jgi:hypothetical protein
VKKIGSTLSFSTQPIVDFSNALYILAMSLEAMRAQDFRCCVFEPATASSSSINPTNRFASEAVYHKISLIHTFPGTAKVRHEIQITRRF